MSCQAEVQLTHLVVDVFGVQAVLIVSHSVHVLLVFGADDDDDQH